MMRISAEPDTSSRDLGTRRVLGSHWSESSAVGFANAHHASSNSVTLDLSNVDFLTLFEWSMAVARIERLLDNPAVSEFAIDLIGETKAQVVPATDFLSFKNTKKRSPEYTQADYALSSRVYELAGFMESIGTRDVLNNRAERTARVFYPGIDISDLNLAGSYIQGKRHSVLLGLTRIDNKEDCRQFLDDHRILSWRNAMGKRFYQSPLFESEEIWRVLCHELAVNIWEHSKAAGFISARVVESPIANKNLRSWCSLTYGSDIDPRDRAMAKGFLELCVVDNGKGFVETLKDIYVERSGRAEGSVTPEDVLCFAFDEFGTSKSGEESWATERHALGRILQIVAKYGGLLTLRSGGAEIFYKSEGRGFERIPNHLGYVPQRIKKFPSVVLGAYLQVILPLHPHIDLAKRREFRPALSVNLPESYRIEPDQARGHLVPLREELEITDSGVGREDQRAFRLACEKLSRKIMKRSRNEALILDFGDLNWTPGQFETLLHLLQNVLQNRPVLLVEIEPHLAKAVDDLERESAPTQLELDGIEVSERIYLETFSRIHSPLLGLDQNGKRFLFGLLDQRYKDPLLSLVETEATVDILSTEVVDGVPLRKSTLQIILNQTSSAFDVSKNALGKPVWRTIWDPRTLAAQASRAISRHFDQVAERSGAWRRSVKGGTSGTPQLSKFHLPWLAEWRKDFLEASKILSRERHADEIAQRLIYRLRLFLESNGEDFQSVRALACVTTPALLLASALHRWWPADPRPAIADLGHYMMLNDEKDLPVIVRSGNVIVVQDVLDKQHVSGGLVAALNKKGIKVLCVCGFVQLVRGLEATRVTAVNEWWQRTVLDPPRHALVQTPRPEESAPPKDPKEDANAFWVEPRSLHPFRYKTLRRDFVLGRDPFLDRRDYYLRLFDRHEGGSLLTSGHYVYGRRHYIITLDIRRALTGKIGDEIAHWLASICEGRLLTDKVRWDSERALPLVGDVTAVLMPLHSQIHYVWPKVENILAQRGRRQPNWWLESTLFTGAGPHYWLPSQFLIQVREAVRESIESMRGPEELTEHPLRVLILDDAIVSAHTAENILATILREIKKAFALLGPQMGRRDRTPEVCPNPLQWIRYFAFLNQMDNSSHDVWHSLPVIGSKRIPILFQEFAPLMGVPIYNEESCPFCQDIKRLTLLKSKCRQVIADGAERWTEERIQELQAVAVDSPDFRGPKTLVLKRPIEVLTTRSRPALNLDKFTFGDVDTAIWRFYELMYLSYPPNDLLEALSTVRASSKSAHRSEYERYRWAVYDWCLQNWSRIRANAAQSIFVKCAAQEVKENTPLASRILEKAAIRSSDAHIIQFVGIVIKRIAKLEKQAYRLKARLRSKEQEMTRLTNGLTLFLLGVPQEELAKIALTSPQSPTPRSQNLLAYLDRESQTGENFGLGFLRNVYRTVTRPERHAEATWTLETLAEALFRGRDPHDPVVSNHELLPRLLKEVRGHHVDNVIKRQLLRSSLALFIGALDDIKPYCGWPMSATAAEVQMLSRKVIEWLKIPPDHQSYMVLPKEIFRLEDALDLDKDFCRSFNDLFHEEVASVGTFLESKVASDGKGRLTFAYLADSEVTRCRVLTSVQGLRVCLANRTIDPIRDKRKGRKCQSRIEVRLERKEHESDRLVFRLLTDFESLEKTRELTNKGPSGHAELAMLRSFGATYCGWDQPLIAELSEGFTSAFEISVLAGFVPRSLR